MVSMEVNILKICISGLEETVFLESFFYTSFMPSLPSFCCQNSCFRACLHYAQYSPCSQRTENLVLEFPG